MANIIECKNVSKVYPRGVIGVSDVSFAIKEGEFVYLLGPSGSGKSTLMKLMHRDERLTAGEIVIADRDVSKLRDRNIHLLRREVGMIFQDFKLLLAKNVYENVAFALEILGVPEEEVEPRVRQTLTLVELADKMQHYPDELSGGEQQRVSIARALVTEPRILLADEPTGNLDPKTSKEIFRLLYRINKRGTTVVLSTHDQHIVEKFRFRILRMEQGKLVLDQAKSEPGMLEYDFDKKDYFIV